jgi:hypothetical protein
MPGYSLEQYLPTFFQHSTRDFSAEVAARLKESLNPLLGIKAVLGNLVRAFDERERIVERGSKLCLKEDCAPGSENYEDWSTPSRDSRIGSYFEQIQAHLSSLSGERLSSAEKLLLKADKKPLARISGRAFHYRELERIWKERRYSSDPRDPPEKRWGFE